MSYISQKLPTGHSVADILVTISGLYPYTSLLHSVLYVIGISLLHLIVYILITSLLHSRVYGFIPLLHPCYIQGFISLIHSRVYILITMAYILVTSFLQSVRGLYPCYNLVAFSGSYPCFILVKCGLKNHLVRIDESNRVTFSLVLIAQQLHL